jgi:ammonium transporter, Amt family
MIRRALSLILFPAIAGIPALAPSPASAPATRSQIAALEQAVRSAQSAGGNAWVLVSADLILLMTVSGLTLFYRGLAHRKNILGTMMQSFAMMGLIPNFWALAGYSLAFGRGHAFIGGFDHVFLRDAASSATPTAPSPCNPRKPHSRRGFLSHNSHEFSIGVWIFFMRSLYAA